MFCFYLLFKINLNRSSWIKLKQKLWKENNICIVLRWPWPPLSSDLGRWVNLEIFCIGPAFEQVYLLCVMRELQPLKLEVCLFLCYLRKQRLSGNLSPSNDIFSFTIPITLYLGLYAETQLSTFPFNNLWQTSELKTNKYLSLLLAVFLSHLCRWIAYLKELMPHNLSLFY